MHFSPNFWTTVLISILTIRNIHSIELPSSCDIDQYYDTGALVCLPCPANSSMTTSTDGFACSCVPHSVPISPSRCQPCNATHVVSSDGSACVPRRCQNSNGRLVCRKCPASYISVTQNLDGSPMKEVQCIRCSRGFVADAKLNVCVRCFDCACATHEEAMAGACVPKRYLSKRGNGDGSVVKQEYLCLQGDIRACRSLANKCVTSFYSTDVTGPCRLWLLPNTTPPKGLPLLNIDLGSGEKKPGEINLNRGMNASLSVAVAIHDENGRVDIVQDASESRTCHLPIHFPIGHDYAKDCSMNISSLDLGATMAAYLNFDDNLIPLPVTLRKPDGQYVQRGTWPNSKFRRYFVRHRAPSSISNITTTVYLRTLLLKLLVERENYKSSLRVFVSLEAQYSTRAVSSSMITLSIRVEHDLPTAGILRGLEVWGGVVGALLSLHATLVWRTSVRRGGVYANIAPFAHAIATALYVAALFSTLHALGAEAGSLGMTLPLSHSEEHTVRAFVYSAIGLMVLKIIGINLNQIKSDIFFLDWSEYNPPIKEINTSTTKSSNWRASALGREWSAMQTQRRAPPGYTATLALLILHLIQPWRCELPRSLAYTWSVAALAWWSAYTAVLLTRHVIDKLFGAPSRTLLTTCRGLGMSLMVFQEDLYAHYVDGSRSDEDSDLRSVSRSLTSCRVVCAPQLRAVYKQLSGPTFGDLQGVMKQALLSRFLAAFFERALDGLSWVASERTMVERLFDVEVVMRENGTTSALLYDNQTTPSCFNLTWWGQEWSLGLFDAMVFGTVIMAGHDSLLAALVTLAVWQVMKISRQSLGNRNLREKTGVDIQLH